jgi:hypothetical protein
LVGKYDFYLFLNGKAITFIKQANKSYIVKWNFQTVSIRDGFSYFRSGGVDKYLGVLLLALAGAWWQRLERPRKSLTKFVF